MNNIFNWNFPKEDMSSTLAKNMRGRCPKCGHNLSMVEMEMIVTPVLEDGRIVPEKAHEGYSCYLACARCRTMYAMSKKGMYVFMNETSLATSKRIENPFYTSQKGLIYD